MAEEFDPAAYARKLQSSKDEPLDPAAYARELGPDPNRPWTTKAKEIGYGGLRGLAQDAVALSNLAPWHTADYNKKTQEGRDRIQKWADTEGTPGSYYEEGGRIAGGTAPTLAIPAGPTATGARMAAYGLTRAAPTMAALASLWKLRHYEGLLPLLAHRAARAAAPYVGQAAYPLGWLAEKVGAGGALRTYGEKDLDGKE